MFKDLFKLHKKLYKTIQANFSEPIEISAVIEMVDAETHIFTIRTDEASKNIECVTKEDISKLNKGDHIIIKGWLRLHQNNIGKIYFAVEYFYILSEKEKYAKALDIYEKLLSILDNNNKIKNIMNKLATTYPPKIIRNVGLIVMPGNEQDIESFKVAFLEKCYGHLYIFHLNNPMDLSLQSAFEYFKEFHNIDLICILTNNLNLNIICALSTVNSVRYMLYRKNVPYIISITTTDMEQVIQPLTVKLSNQKINGIINCIDFIHDIQSSFMAEINKGINTGVDILEKIIRKYQEKLFDLKMCISKLSDHRFLSKLDDSPVEKLKNLLIKRMVLEKDILHNIQITIMKNIINDQRVQKYYIEIIQTEKKIQQGKKNVSFNDFNEQLSPKNNIKRITLQQNQYLQEYPEYLDQTKQTLDSITTELMQTKKIEDKLFDNIPTDILSDNIQRNNNNGDIK